VAGDESFIKGGNMITKISDGIYEETKEVKTRINIAQIDTQIARFQKMIDDLKARKSAALAVKE
jgi:hypothetical protein